LRDLHSLNNRSSWEKLHLAEEETLINTMMYFTSLGAI